MHEKLERAEATPERRIDWDALHAAYVRGDERDGQLLLSLLHAAVPKIVWRLDGTLRQDEVDELASRVMGKLHGEGRLRQYRGPKRFLGWVRQVVANERADFFRERRHEFVHVAGSIDDPDAGAMSADAAFLPPSRQVQRPDQVVSSREVEQFVKDCIHKQREGDRAILRLRLLEQRDYEDIARELRITSSQAYLRYLRARRRVAECLAGHSIRSAEQASDRKDNQGARV